jgi:hypothetical protein
MKKTVQIVTIPLNKEGWGNNALLKRQPPQIDQYIIADKGSNPITESIWEAQQLLVLSDDKIQVGDTFLDSFGKIDTYLEGEFQPVSSGRKIIASYPQLSTTLPISKETVQAWIDSGTPEEGSVGFITNTKNHTEKYSVYFPDPQGNLLLEFGEKDSLKNIMSTGYKWETIEEFADSFKPSKPSIPTDEEIERKAHNNYTYGYLMPIGSHDRSRYEEKKESYTSGYKQALKDLGHE